MIDVRRLGILHKVAEHGSFSRAAADLRLTPSAVSQQIAALERALGITAVTRSTRGVVLTEAGRLLVEAAETIEAELRHTRDRVDRLADGRTRATIATFTSGGHLLLPDALTRYVAAYPHVELTVWEREPEESLALVRRNQVDLALAYHFDGPLPLGPDPRLEWTPLLDDPFSIVLPAGHRLAGRAELDLADLAGERWVLGCLKTEGYLRRHAGFALDIAASTTDYFFAQSLVAAGVGVSLIPEVGLSPSPALVSVPVAPPRPARRFGVVTAGRRHRQPHIDALVEAIRLSSLRLSSLRTGEAR